MINQTRGKKRRLVILIHGIRTHADWQHNMIKWLKADGVSTIVVAPGYGYFDAFRFWFPFVFRRMPVKKVLRKLDDLLPDYPELEWDRFIIAHSFGTYTITKVLEERPSWRFSGIVLCGSIVPVDYNWGRIAGQILNGGSIVNHCGAIDVWPPAARAFSWGYGSTGTYGMQSGHVIDRLHHIGHSDFFTQEFAKTYWKPFIYNREVPKANDDQPAIDRPKFFRLLDLPIKSMLVACALISVMYLRSDLVRLAIDYLGINSAWPPSEVQSEPEITEAARLFIKLGEAIGMQAESSVLCLERFSNECINWDDAVHIIQAILKETGCYDGEINGNTGLLFNRAVRRFHKARFGDTDSGERDLDDFSDGFMFIEENLDLTDKVCD